MEPDELFGGYANLGTDMTEGKKDDFKTRQMTCYVKELPKDEVPEFLKEQGDEPRTRRMTCIQMLK